MRSVAAWAIVWLFACGTAFAADPLPIEYPTGDSCLFCHRSEVGSTWLDNAHAWTIRAAGEPPAISGALPSDATHVIGRDHFRALRQSGYGKFAMPNRAGQWEEGAFGTQCAGCHTTAVNPRTLEFSATALDCYTCHGNVPENHAEKRGTALLSRARESNAAEISAICGSCHLRGGRSQSSGLPYPNGFVPGADLFKDFKVDLSRDLKNLDDNDRHVYETTRAVLEGKSEDTCVDCHRVHTTPEKHEGKRRRFSEVCGY
ncbi:cytochrome c553 [Povalibacter uvarum]|uniref:Cytochrome c553 n=1 Tax=Povalibacter uvarum TaxID=732238 RepID=A0A841HNM4_9GAMM|nr:cytochrome c3 family protein [Povalibacter uvarum]MBB6094363.1 cytochrome c553 [Povalibacter uvarum]